jgi:hypothetical protein
LPQGGLVSCGRKNPSSIPKARFDNAATNTPVPADYDQVLAFSDPIAPISNDRPHGTVSLI